MDTGNEEVLEYVPKKLFKRLSVIAVHRKEEKNMDRGRTALSAYNKIQGTRLLTPDQTWSYNFFHLLLEMIKHWGTNKSIGENKGLPTPFLNLYNNLRNSSVSFPVEKKFLDWPEQTNQSVLIK